MKQVTYKGLTFVPYLEKEKIQDRIKVLGAQIAEDCKGKNPLFICVLNGAFAFASDLFREVDLPGAEITFIRLKSYEGTSSTGVVKEVIGLTEDITDRTVIIIEDIVDTGNTIHRLVGDLKEESGRYPHRDPSVQAGITSGPCEARLCRLRDSDRFHYRLRS